MYRLQETEDKLEGKLGEFLQSLQPPGVCFLLPDPCVRSSCLPDTSLRRQFGRRICGREPRSWWLHAFEGRSVDLHTEPTLVPTVDTLNVCT